MTLGKNFPLSASVSSSVNGPSNAHFMGLPWELMCNVSSTHRHHHGHRFYRNVTVKCTRERGQAKGAAQGRPLSLTLGPQQPPEQSSHPTMKPWVPPPSLASHPTTSLLNLQSYRDSHLRVPWALAQALPDPGVPFPPSLPPCSPGFMPPLPGSLQRFLLHRKGVGLPTVSSPVP